MLSIEQINSMTAEQLIERLYKNCDLEKEAKRDHSYCVVRNWHTAAAMRRKTIENLKNERRLIHRRLSELLIEKEKNNAKS